MPNSRYYSSIAAATNLQVTANPGDTSIQVASSVGWPGSFPFIVSLDYGAANEELVLATSGGPNIFQVTRAYDGTPASTHNAGAVVRHVSSAIDFTDSRTHEASSSGVHGISGSFVDTNSVQTLNNKTLNAPVLNNPTIAGTAVATGATINNGTYSTPTINNPTMTGGGSLAGTYTGSPTLSGAPTFTGGPNFTTNPATFTGSVISTIVERTRVTGDTQDRLAIRADGGLNWGSGSGATDVVLNRGGAGFLNVGGSLTASGSITANANLLGDDISLNTTNFTSFTPVYTNTGGATTAVNVGWYKKLGKMVYVTIYTAWSGTGTGTSGVTVDLPSIPFRAGAGANTTRQMLTGDLYGTFSTIHTGLADGLCTVPFFAGDTTARSATIRDFSHSFLLGENIASTTILTIEGWYREA
jgi:hypothetical protein